MDGLNTTNQVHHENNLEHVLILTPFKESARHIERYFENVNRLTYPHNLISLAFLVSDSNDGTVEKLQEYAGRFRFQQEAWQRFRRISIFQRDFSFELAGNEDRHAFEVQVKRRQIMAKSRNTLLSAALTEEISWVLWLDGDVIEYPATLLEELISLDKDIVVPNCYWHSYNEEGGYDKNNWQETPESWALQKTLEPEDVLVEGYKELTTHRRLMIDMKGADDRTDIFYAVPLDGVGGTCTLVKAEVHRNGAVFPPFSFKHQVETEGLAKMAKALGYEVWGLPNYLVYHFI
ncbi:glycosyltransferase family 62 protein [Phycomyces blakesleeanus NRRL 1555(-)]|uniref:Glycosyltransferase family 62 protein n=2 Tax=Phycomyces blakesleeanus TaxID=4837 RepID=A0A167QRQ7_PHYB8|nr:glycosyltransferase family 62 protein [Phycomyces blakesleeanus NRRL 1555(-)]OAD80150.1 glycosyltransferase family 62 protein [Phycomyces blakesleeanus NRRL 1555(-)]|eukprot:XP_018298190.1 glycosyltransferase family 62 protein [Phycomyces blakesleeanus NRRL 1555(-)]